MAQDPRPIIQKKLTEPFVNHICSLPRHKAENLLNKHIPEGAPWTVDERIMGPLGKGQYVIQATLPEEFRD
jgi:hypothetical protein